MVPAARAAIGTIPACAGSTQRQRVQELVSKDHPRRCGEHGLIEPDSPCGWGPSPPAMTILCAASLPRFSLRDPTAPFLLHTGAPGA